MSALFGPAGNEKAFADVKSRDTLDAPEYVAALGLTAYEYQCGRGVNIGKEKSELFGKKAREAGVRVSLHAPYYISMSGVDREKRMNSIGYIVSSAEAVKAMGLSVEVEYITDMQKVMEYGVMSMPAIVVNEKVVSMGKVLKAADMEKLLRKSGF